METLQPKLRFPEFKGNWIKDILGNLIEIKSGHSPSTYNLKLEGENPFIKVDELNNCNKYQLISREYSDDSKGIIPFHSILFPKRGAAILNNKVRINASNILMDSNMMALSPKKGKIYYEFLYYLITKVELYKIADTSTIPQINNKHIEPFKVNIPSLDEQTKIANFLSSVDEKLNLLKEKKSLLEDYKKGIMQKIFNQEIRFKDDNGNDFEDWEKKIFKEVFSFRSTNSLSRDKLNYFEGTVKNIHYGDIHTKFKTLFDIENEKVPFINNDVSIEKIPLDNYLKVGDLVIADASEDYDDIGKSIEIINLNNSKVLAGLHTFVARPFDNLLSIGFIGFLMKSDDIKLQIKIMAQGTKVLSLSPTRFAEIKFSLPCLKEQIKIANFLSAIDEKIELVSNQIQDTQEYKKGLLQQMFV